MQVFHPTLQKVIQAPRSVKKAIVVAVDCVLCLFTVALAYKLRLDVWTFPDGRQWLSYAAAIMFSVPIFVRAGLYRAIFRYVGWDAFVNVVAACACYGALYFTVFTLVGIADIPRTIGFLQPILLFMAVAGVRAVARYLLQEAGEHKQKRSLARRILIYGAGASGRQFAAAMSNSREMDVVGFVDDEIRLHGSYMSGKPIYPADDIVELIESCDVDDVLLAVPSASRQRRNEIINGLKGLQVSVRTLPDLTDLAYGRVTVSDMRPLDIDDLLGRDSVPPHAELLEKCISDRVVMVTGAGGSIGSEICRQVLEQRPSTLLLVEQSEYNLYVIVQDLTNKITNEHFSTKIVPILASVQDEQRISTVLERWKPDTIFHAAAYKHVPLVEDNPTEGVLNNIFGTRNMVMLAEKAGVSDFVLISTDKAVRPTNIMGTTKRIAEMILQAKVAAGSNTRFSMVRFGNVLGSSGSVVPLFRKQIATGGPITVTHPEVTRYFMTIPEAAQLVIQASGMAQGGEVFVLDMGDPVKIVDLAKRMIELSGLTVKSSDDDSGDIMIKIVGLRPGEKLYEELLIGNDPSPTSHTLIMKAHDAHPDLLDLERELSKLYAASREGDSETVMDIIQHLVPEFAHAPHD